MKKTIPLILVLCFICFSGLAQGLFKSQVLLESKEEGYYLLVEEEPAYWKMVTRISAGPGMVQMSGDLKKIMELFFPGFIFEVSQPHLNSNYEITLRHEGYKRDEVLMKKVLGEIGSALNLDIVKKMEDQTFYCLEIKDQGELKNHLSEQKVGTQSMMKKTLNKINLKGYTIDEVVGILNKETDHRFWSAYDWTDDQSYDLSLNISDHHTIANSLNELGLKMYGCEKKVPVIFIQ